MYWFHQISHFFQLNSRFIPAVLVITFLTYGLPAQAVIIPGNSECPINGTTVTCTGDLGEGVFVDGINGYLLLEVEDVTEDIEPVIYIPGIAFTSTGAITITSDTGDYEIITVDAHGIAAYTTAGTEDVSVTHAGDITTIVDFAYLGFGHGIYASAYSGNVTVDMTGNIQTEDFFDDGIYAEAIGDSGDTVVTMTGNIDAGNDGIYAYSSSGTVEVTVDGDIDAGADGIIADAAFDVTVTMTGAIDAEDDGIFVYSEIGSVTVDMTGDITAGDDGIYAQGAFDVTVTMIGDIVADDDGIIVDAFSDATVTMIGNIDAVDDGINVLSTAGSITINQTGYIDAEDDGIDVYSWNDSVTIIQTGNITAGVDAIFADGETGVTVTMTGDIDAGDDGIDIYSVSGSVTINQTGDIEAGVDAIFADGAAGATVDMTGDIDAEEDGMEVYSRSGSVTIIQTGDIYAGAYGIYADAETDATVTQTGNIYSVGDGIYAHSDDSLVTGDYTVTVLQIGDITTTGDDSDGIYAGADGGSTEVTQTGDIAATGDGIDAYADEDVTVTQTGDIEAGDDGIDAYSDSGSVTVIQEGDIYAVYDGIYADGETDVTVTQTGNITSGGDGIYAYSWGGTGYNSGDGDLKVTQTGTISTTGYGSAGIYAVASGDAAITVMQTGDITTTGEGIYASSGQGDINVTQIGNIISGYEGIYAFSEDGSVTVNQTGDITAELWDGIYAESYGDGDVEVNQVGDISVSDDAGNGIQAESDSGAVSVTQEGDIDVTGDNGHGIQTRSSGGDITVTQTGNITTTGYDSSGIHAYSSDSGAVSVTHAGDIITEGDGSEGIYARSIGGSISITLNGGSITSALSEGVEFSGGTTNTLHIYDSVYISGGTYDILGDAADDTIEIHGTLTTPGDIDLGGGTNNAINILEGGRFNSGDYIGLGGLLTNAGTLSPGGSGTIQITFIDGGDLVQTETGDFAVDLDLETGDSDQLLIEGTADLAGTVSLTAADIAQQLLETDAPVDEFVIVATGNGVTDSGLELNTNSVLLNGELEFSNEEFEGFPDVDVVKIVNLSLDFTPDDADLNKNQTNIAANLDDVLAEDDGSLDTLLVALVGESPTNAMYASNLDQLSPSIYLDGQTSTLFSANHFIDQLFSCRATAGLQSYTKEGREGECFWMRVAGQFSDRYSDREAIGYDEDNFGVSLGAQMAFAPGWTMGFGMGYDDSGLDTDTGAQSDSDRFSLGAVLKYHTGSFTVAAALSGGANLFDSTRPIDFGTLSSVAKSDHDIKTVTGQLRFAYLMTNGTWYARPQVDFTATHIDRDGFTETGAGDANLTVDGSTETYLSVSPAIELGGDIASSGGNVIQPYVRAGVTVFNKDSHSLSANFTNSSIGSFTIKDEFGDIFANVAAGMVATVSDRASLNVGYEGTLGENLQQHGFFAKASISF